MEQALGVHRLHFAFTITFHYIFPQLTMGLALLILYLKTQAIRANDEHYNHAARFWARIFGVNFALGVVTGIPMEFSIRDELGAVFKSCRRRHRTNAGDGRNLFLLSGIELPWIVSFR